MTETTLTVKQIMDLGLWSKVCEYKGWDEWIYNEGKIEDNALVTFDSEFKNQEISYKESRMEELKDAYYKGEIDYIDLIKIIIELEVKLKS